MPKTFFCLRTSEVTNVSRGLQQPFYHSTLHGWTKLTYGHKNLDYTIKVRWDGMSGFALKGSSKPFGLCPSLEDFLSLRLKSFLRGCCLGRFSHFLWASCWQVHIFEMLLQVAVHADSVAAATSGSLGGFGLPR